MAELLFRHDKFRRGQKQFTQDCWDALQAGDHLLAHVPTGSGKTDAAVSAAVTYAKAESLDVFFLTPKTTQHDIALQAVVGLAKKYDARFPAVDFVGKRNLCLEPAAFESTDFYRVCDVLRKKAACDFYENYRHTKFQAIEDLKGRSYGHQELRQAGQLRAGCPYELALDLARESRMVIADYNHLFLPAIREGFLHRLQKKMQSSILIVDEAHNLFNRVQSAMSATLAFKTVLRASEEAAAIGLEPMAAQLRSLDADLQAFCDEKRAGKEEARVEKEELLAFLDAPTTLLRELESTAETYLETHPQARRSAAGQFANFLGVWQEGGKDSFVRLVHADKGLLCRSLDVRPYTQVLNEAHSTIAMSGTLLPLDMHRSVLGLDGPRTRMRQYASPFPSENRLNVIATGTSTQFKRRTEEGFDLLADHVRKIIEAAGGKTAIFFPSYLVLSQVCRRLELPGLLVQGESMDTAQAADLLARFRKQAGVLCAVAGGSFSEGVDFDGQQIHCAVIVGIPLAEMNLEQEALMAYYEAQFGRGWEYGYTFPAMNKALQAAGRGIRSEKDKCVVVFLDDRYAWANYRSGFPSDFEAVQTDQPWKYVEAFLGGLESGPRY